MANDYLLLEDGVSRLLLEDGTGALLLESSTADASATGVVHWCRYFRSASGGWVTWLLGG